MIEEFSEAALRKTCLHCDPSCWVFEYLLEASSYFYVLCDANPIVEGHLLIIPKRHVSCIGEYTQEEYREFKQLYTKVSGWILEEYGSIATFEHGKIGQTVFHSHIHLMPFSREINQVVPEGSERLRSIRSTDTLFDIFQEQGQYLFVSIGAQLWIVDASLGAPRFFRDRFAGVLNKTERANWKEVRQNPLLLRQCREDNMRCKEKILQSLRAN